MTENEIAKVIVNTCFDIHKNVGPGMMEKSYEEILSGELEDLNLDVKRQLQIPITYKGRIINSGFIADLVVNDKVIVEIKSIANLADVHYTILLTYLRFSGMKLGLLVNFREQLIKNGIKRVVNNLEENVSA